MLRIWTLTTGEIGMQNQALGLAEAVGGEISLKTVRARAPWSWLPGHWAPKRIGAVVANAGDFAGPPPDLVISCGRRSVPAALALRTAGALAVHIQKPGVPARCFDLIAAPRHDGFTGPNVMQTHGALHRVTQEKLAAAREEWLPRFADWPGPRVAVSVGGKSGAYDFAEADARALSQKLKSLTDAGYSLLVTTSRRTGEANTAILRDALPDAYFWSGEADGPNPYYGLLASADHIVATCDSANMVSEACFTGKPVHVAELPGGNKRFRRFLDELYAEGLARPFEGAPLEGTAGEPHDDRTLIAERIREMLHR